ncbi:MAG: flavin reductase family protein [Verrucomicrobia bacterium]|nr:flavin reductase family protein [Verrucomicrobiota bacterium]MCG2680231.1 flavin reductase family protein [Kiritimatiellia bacterium]MBU4247676.1 flavin reductase family protein [Verrucomicrobiota bacterium]MBU4289804.1 flavin reductase family protein [Verrucomicrobiota bacterium]MBU4428053.1 flavin reductase family protein [Verrucomicrobiota bacterium]
MQIQTTPEQALKRKYPEQVVLVATRNPKGRANVMAVGWTAIASEKPLMFMLAIDAGAFTYRLICETKEFVVAFPNEQMGPAVLYAGTHHGHKIDKIAVLRLKTQKAAKVKAPLIAAAVANFECRLVRIFKPGDCPLIIGRVVAAHRHRDASIRRLYTVGPGYRLSGVRILNTLRNNPRNAFAG